MIKIKKENKGKFTDYCGGKVTGECITRGKHSSDPKIRKRAVFAENARSWKHKQGGVVKYEEGGILKTLLQIVDPTGISSWGDVGKAGTEFADNMNLKTTGNLLLNILGAIPILGKVTAPIKALKALKLLDKSGDAVKLLEGAAKAEKTGSITKLTDEIAKLIKGKPNVISKTKLISDTGTIKDEINVIDKLLTKLSEARKSFIGKSDKISINKLKGFDDQITKITKQKTDLIAKHNDIETTLRKQKNSFTTAKLSPEIVDKQKQINNLKSEINADDMLTKMSKEFKSPLEYLNIESVNKGVGNVKDWASKMSVQKVYNKGIDKLSDEKAINRMNKYNTGIHWLNRANTIEDLMSFIKDEK